MRRWQMGLAVTVVLLGTCGAIALVPRSGPHRAGEAAVAIRDAVPGYQQLFTERYTVPRLEAAYERYWYFTEASGLARHRELYQALDEATLHFAHVDLFLLAHGNRYVDIVRRLPDEQRARLRLVYDTGGGSARQGPEWMRLGIGSFVGHPGGNVAPAFYVEFLPRWLKDQDAPKAVREANLKVHGWMYGTVGNVANRFTDRDALWDGTEAQLFQNRAP
ncbi:MAG: hypothetical protein IPJ65_01260 [Archangiaceae bacterium]|nr:hypothetical protein [Archangiaceae bacterium]